MIRSSLLSLLLCSLALTALAPTENAEAQAWIRDPGSAFIQLNYRLIRAERLYAPDGSVVDIRPYRQHAVGLYAEAGVVDRWLMLAVDGELFRRGVLPDQGAVSGLGDIGIAAWTGILEAPFRLAFGVRVGIPTGDVNPDSDENDPSSQAIADVLPTGDGEVDVALRLAAGHGFGWRKVQQYVLADVGYIIRTTPRDAPGGLTPGDIRDQFSWRFETGIRIDRPFIERFWFILRVGGLVIVQDRSGESSGPPRFAGLGDGVDYTSFGIETAFRMAPGLSVSFGVDGAFAARNVPAAPAWKLGLSYEIQ